MIGGRGGERSATARLGAVLGVFLLAVVACGTSSSTAVAQLPTRDAETVGQVQLVNRAAHPRRDIVTTVVPFAEGAYTGQPLAVDGKHAHAAPFGARWPDGTWRYVRLTFPHAIGAQERLLVDVTDGQGTVPPFRLADSIVGGGQLVFGLVAGGNASSPAAAFWGWECIEANPLAKTFRARLRLPTTPVWGELTIEFRHDLDHVRWWLTVGAADMTRSEQSYNLPPLWFVVRGPEVAMWHAPYKQIEKRVLDPWTAIELDAGGKWGDGQGIANTGTFLFDPGPGGDLETLDAERTGEPLHAVSSSWAQTGAYGAWGYVRGPPPGSALNSTAAVQRFLSDYGRHTKRDPFGWCAHGCAPDPNGTGSQTDFSATPMQMEALGFPTRLHSVGLSVLQNAARPTHLRTADGSPYLFTDHPEVLLWHSVVDHRITGNKLGKSRTLNWSDCRSTAFGKWGGLGWEHWSVQYLTHYAMLTGDRWALEECQHHAELLLGTMHTNSASPVLNSMGASRAVGRMMHSGTMLYLVTGRQDLLTRMMARVGVVEKQWRGRNTSPCRPAVVRGPDPRNLGGLMPFAFGSWQDALGVLGLDAYANVSGDTRADTLAQLWAQNTVNFSMLDDPNSNRWLFTKNEEWKGGAWHGWQEFTGVGGAEAADANASRGDALQEGEFPFVPALTLEEMESLLVDPLLVPPRVAVIADPAPNFVEIYNPYGLWMLGATIVARRHALARGDQATVDKCDQVLAQVLGGRPSWATWEWSALAR